MSAWRRARGMTALARRSARGLRRRHLEAVPRQCVVSPGLAHKLLMCQERGLGLPAIIRCRAWPMRLRRAGYFEKLPLCQSIKDEGVPRTV